MTQISKDCLELLGDECADYIYKNSGKWIEIYEYDYEINFDLSEIITAGAQVLLENNHIDQWVFEELVTDCSWTADIPILKQALHNAIDDLIDDIEYDMGDECAVSHTASDFLP
jgi:hypothetical protein